MRKGIADAKSGTIPFDVQTLKALKKKGYKFVQVKGLTIDNHYEYTEPRFLLLVPMKELPEDPAKKDIYETIESEILNKWASEKDENLPILIANNLFR